MQSNRKVMKIYCTLTQNNYKDKTMQLCLVPRGLQSHLSMAVGYLKLQIDLLYHY